MNKIMTVVFSHHEMKIDLKKLHAHLKKKTFGVMGGLNLLIFQDSFVIVKNQEAYEEFEDFAKKAEAIISKT